MPILGMDREDVSYESDVDGIGQFFAHGLRGFDKDTAIETLIKLNESSKRDKDTELSKERLKIKTSDGYKYAFTRRALWGLQSELLNKFWETDDVFDFTRQLVNCDAQVLETILALVKERDKKKFLAALPESEIEKLIIALDELQMPLCNEVCEWVANNYDFTKFDGKNLFPGFIKDKEERCCYPLQQALVKKLRSTDFALKEMGKNPITLAGHTDRISSVEIATDNSFIVTGSWDGTAKIWRLNEEHELEGEPIILAGHTDKISSVAIATDNSFIVTVSYDRTANIWRLNEEHELLGAPITLTGHTDWIFSVAISSDNSFVVTGSRDNTAKIWRLNEDHEFIDESITLEGHQDLIYSVAIASDNSFIVTGARDGMAKIWRLNAMHERVGEPITLEGHKRMRFGRICVIDSITIASDNSFIVTRSTDKTARIWRLNEEHKLVGESIALDYDRWNVGVSSVSLAIDNSFIVTGLTDGSVRVWNEDFSSFRLWRLADGHTDNIRSVAISSDNSFVVTGSNDRTAKIWRLNEEHERVGEPITLEGHQDLINSVAIARDNSFVVTGSGDRTVKIWRMLKVDAVELNLSQILLLLKLATSPSKIDFTKETVEIQTIYESLPENLKRIFDRCNDTTLTKIWKTIKNPKVFIPTVAGIGTAAWLVYKFMKS